MSPATTSQCGNQRELTWVPSSNFRQTPRRGGRIDGAPREDGNHPDPPRCPDRTRQPMEPAGGRGPEEGTAPGGRRRRRMTSDTADAGDAIPIRTRTRRSPALMLLLTGVALGGCSGGDFGRSRDSVRNDDMHRWLGAEATGSVGIAVAIPAHRQRTPAARPRLSADRAAAFASGLEERVRQLQAAAVAMAAGGDIRPHRLWPPADRRAAPLALVALCRADGGRPQRHHPVRAILRHRGARDRARPQARRQPETGIGTVTARTRRCGRPHAGEHV